MDTQPEEVQPKKDYDPYEYKPDPARANSSDTAKPAGKNLIPIIGLVIILAAALYIYSQIQTTENNNQPLLGGDKDAGGCLIAAGYSWCEPKQKCLRIWEEKCYESEETALTEVFATAHEKTLADTHVTVITLQNNYASGSITFGPDAVAGGVFLARFDNDTWVIDYEGNGSVDCITLRDLGYTQQILTGFCDPACTEEAKICPDGSTVGRVGPDCEFAACPDEDQPDTATLSEPQARTIAEQSCIKGGESLAPGYYNSNSQTWWFDANLNSVREGCNPACVVDEATQTAEINWRCTGLIMPDEEQGSVSGQILLGPTCPVIQNPPDPACADKPYQTTIQIIDRYSPAGAPFKVITSDQQGNYAVTLPVGEYNFQPKGGEFLPSCEAQDITVSAGATLNINFSCDSGIR